MVPLMVLLPLAAGGVAAALWRQYKQRQHTPLPDALPYLETNQVAQQDANHHSRVFDDVGELHHYQRVTWYALAFAASGAWFYPPATLVSLPLLSYNAYHFLRTLHQSDASEQKSPISIFQIISITGTLVTGRALAASVLLLFSFTTRKLLLQAGNISHHVGFAQPFNPRKLPVWVLRDGAEIETTIAGLQQTDIVVLHPGDTIALHGEVIQGHGVVHQFSLRKQIKSLPKQTGDKVFPYTQLASGCLYVQLSR
jgi:cation transport ATPase